MTIDLSPLQQQGESFHEWQMRLIVDKIEKNSDVDWVIIKDLLNYDCSRDHFRKMARGIYEYKDYVLGQGTLPSPTSVEADIVRKERMNLADERRMKNANLRYDARFDRIREDIERSVVEIAMQKPLSWKKPYLAGDGNKEGLAVFSDWHKGLFARNYWNNFDNEEFDRRVEKLTSRVILHGKENGINKLHVFISGDLVNGLIHVTTRINATEDVVTQTQSVSETLSEVLSRFANEFADVNVYFCRGNHDRISPHKSDEITKESFADIIPWYLKARLSHIKNITFHQNAYDDEIVDAKIAGRTVYSVHGHRDKVSNVAQNLTMMTKVVPDYIVMGHYHHHEELEVHGVEVIVNSSLSGVDSYAKDIRLTGKPAQKFMIFNENEGRICTYNIRLDT